MLQVDTISLNYVLKMIKSYERQETFYARHLYCNICDITIYINKGYHYINCDNDTQCIPLCDGCNDAITLKFTLIKNNMIIKLLYLKYFLTNILLQDLYNQCTSNYLNIIIDHGDGLLSQYYTPRLK